MNLIVLFIVGAALSGCLIVTIVSLGLGVLNSDEKKFNYGLKALLLTIVIGVVFFQIASGWLSEGLGNAFKGIGRLFR